MQRSLSVLLAAASGALAAQTWSSPGSAEDPRLEATLRELLSHVEFVELDDGSGNPLKTLRLSGVNLQIVNGADPAGELNGLGNLILGYADDYERPVRTGSHNLMLGNENGYSSHGGIVSGRSNHLSGPGATVLSSQLATAGGFSTAVIGSLYSDVSGNFNVILADDGSRIENFNWNAVIASIGSQIVGESHHNVISSGAFNTLDTTGYCSINGSNTTTVTRNSGFVSTLGGDAHTATGGGVLVGGSRNRLDSNTATIVGGLGNTAGRARHATVVGGENNRAEGDYSVVGGGKNRTATGDHDWVAGGLFQDQ